MADGGDRGDNTARCECGHGSYEHSNGSLWCLHGMTRFPKAYGCSCHAYRPAPAADRQTDEERQQSTPHVCQGCDIPLAEERHADGCQFDRLTVLADLRDGIRTGVPAALDRDKLREAVARHLYLAYGHGDEWSWDNLGADHGSRRAAYRRADAVLALPEMRALLGAAQRANSAVRALNRVEALAEDPTALGFRGAQAVRAALGGEGA